MKKKFDFIVLFLTCMLCFNSISNTAYAAEINDIVIYFDFKDDGGSFTQYLPHGLCALTHDNTRGYNGNGCILVSGRSEPWNGLSIIDDPALIRENTYEVSAYLYHELGETVPMLCTLKALDETNTDNYFCVSLVEVPSGQWTKIQGTFSIPDYALRYALYFETQNTTGDFFIDEISVKLTQISESQHIQEGKGYITPDFLSEMIPSPEANQNNGQNIVQNTPSTTEYVRHVEKEESSSMILPVIIGICICSLLALFVYKKQDMLGLSKSRDKLTGALTTEEYRKKIDALQISPSMYKELYVAVCDVVFVGFINDNHGFESGDYAIKKCADILISTIGKKGFVYRTNGDKFVCISSAPFRNKLEEALNEENQRSRKKPFFVATGFSFAREDVHSDITSLIMKAESDMLKNKSKIKSENTNLKDKYKN